ncbi:MAG: hypothetical protein JSV31_08000 [Desulfobacterales bacterium]|nr:MAG: hypothetical protein JSV31_08000 [Desulfobacterales bacterium]
MLNQNEIVDKNMALSNYQRQYLQLLYMIMQRHIAEGKPPKDLVKQARQLGRLANITDALLNTT